MEISLAGWLLILLLSKVAGEQTVFVRDVDVMFALDETKLIAKRCDGTLDDSADVVLVRVKAQDNNVVYVVRACDDFAQAASVMCAALGNVNGVRGVACAADFLRFALQSALFDEAERALFTLRSIEATAGFNEANEDLFSTDYVTSNWAIAWWVYELGSSQQRVLEIGSFEGRSAWLWSRILPPGSSLTCVDLGFAGTFERNTAALRESGFLRQVLGGRASVRALFDLDPDQPFDLVYIDGSHKADHVLADIVMSDALLRSGGLMLLDDFEWSGVSEPLRLFLQINSHRFEIIHAFRQLCLRKVDNPATALYNHD